jgi:glycine/D-amino acid oxidase-like deaminating enzyme
MLGSSKEESRDLNGSQEEADVLLERAVRYVPALEGTEVFPMPLAYRPMPVDGFPIIGFTEAVPNLYVALTHSGITLAPIIGELATMEIVDRASVDILAPYRLNRFSTSSKQSGD